MIDFVQQPQLKNGINLMYAIGLAVVVAIIMVFVTTALFYKSGAYTTVKQIQTANQYAKTIDKDSLDVTSSINATDIEKYAQSINSRLNSINDNADFSLEEITDKNLGLY
ncbi:MAG: hypothetical protein WCP03_00340 [Candidatus Saccharibacteria bacterium]